MKVMVGIGVAVCAIIGIVMAGESTVQAWIGDGAHAQSSACYQNCTNVRRWPAAQCRRYCRVRR